MRKPPETDSSLTWTTLVGKVEVRDCRPQRVSMEVNHGTVVLVSMFKCPEPSKFQISSSNMHV